MPLLWGVGGITAIAHSEQMSLGKRTTGEGDHNDLEFIYADGIQGNIRVALL